MDGGRRRSPGRLGPVARWAAAAVAALLCGGLLAACTSTSTSPSPTAVEQDLAAGRPPTRTEEFLPGLTANVWEPPAPGPGPLVVLVPGGGWVSADPAGLAPMAAVLSDAGMTVVTVTYRTSTEDAYFPAPLEDVLCAVAYAAAIPTGTGTPSRPVVVVGHSAGANLAALAALTPGSAAPSCPYPAVAPDALVGLAGPYDVAELTDVGAAALFGEPPEDAPQAWEDGNPVRQADRRAEVPVLLLHGEDDPLVLVSFTTAFAEALTDGGHDVTVELVPGADHSIYRIEAVADRLSDWIGALG